MEYLKTHEELKTLFSPDKNVITIPGQNIKINNIGFRSDESSDCFSNTNDNLIRENHSFTYPVFTPPNTESKKVILLLHGLNERSWVKYLAWAYYLARNTDSYVILFPISFHINRSPVSWRDPRAMIPFMKQRNSQLGEINNSSFANIALSNRLTEDPMRFFNSGYQTVSDITKLLLAIKRGEHQLIPRDCRINIFAYSIGAFLAQIMVMGNPEKLFDETKLFIFCGGSVFSNMRGASKLIMDSVAFDRVYKFYLNDFENNLTGTSPLTVFLSSSQIGIAFRSMIDLGRFKSFRENIFKKLHDQIRSITLAGDNVIPSQGVVATLGKPGKKTTVNVWDFPYAYSHENPFPILSQKLGEKVDECFNRVFSEASLYLE
jgi:hypothetical protein